MRGLRRVWRAVRRALADDDPAAYCWLYTKSGATLRGVLVGRDGEAYTLEHADVAPEGATGFRQLRGRVRIPVQQVDYWVESSPEVRAR